jgi:hypothetical protein
MDKIAAGQGNVLRNAIILPFRTVQQLAKLNLAEAVEEKMVGCAATRVNEFWSFC